jgi:hypothetical protein
LLECAIGSFEVMLRYSVRLFRSSAFISLLWVALLLPTLHLHPFLEHEHGHDESHRHGVVHADFLASVVAHGHAEIPDDQDVSEGEPTASYQIKFSALVSRCDPFLLRVSQTLPIFFLEEPYSLSRSIRRWIPKSDHPPPIAEFYPSLGLPRSPPRSV